MTRVKLLSIDFQKEFSAPEGKHYKPRPCVDFIKRTLVPSLREKNIKMAEIISDYRQPRPGDRDDCNHPGTEAYKSEIPDDVKLRPVWVKCMNSPIWTRENIGVANQTPGLPYQDPEAFLKWVHETIGDPEDVDLIVLVGLTLDCCVFCTAQELNFHAYKVAILKEACDTYSNDPMEKEFILSRGPLMNWAKAISWDELKRML